MSVHSVHKGHSSENKVAEVVVVNLLRRIHKLPHIHCKFNGMTCSALLDTGSAISVLSYELYTELNPKPKLKPCGNSVIISESNSSLPVVGRVMLNVTIGSTVKPYEFAGRRFQLQSTIRCKYSQRREN